MAGILFCREIDNLFSNRKLGHVIIYINLTLGHVPLQPAADFAMLQVHHCLCLLSFKPDLTKPNPTQPNLT